MTNTDQPIHININRDYDISSVDYNEFKDYIIKNNINLQNDYKYYLKLNKDLEASITEKDDEIDRNENKIRYLKGLLVNLNELRNYYTLLKNETSAMNKFLLEKCNNLFTIVKHLITNLLIGNVIILHYCIINYNSYYNFINIIFTAISMIIILNNINTIINSYVDKKNLFEIKNKLFIENLNKTSELIKKTEDSCLALDNWICEI